MALFPSNNIVTNGLVFSYDLNSKLSYKGPPLQNKLSALSANTGSGTGYVLTASSETVKIPSVGELQVTTCNLQNTGASWCCVNFMNFGNTGNIISGSTLYTYMILYRIDSGYTHPNFMYRYEYNSSGTYLTESGIHDTNKRTYLGNGWYYAWNTFTTQPTTANMTCYGFSYNYSNFTDRYSYAKVAIVQGDYSGMHPTLWPNLGVSVLNTQILNNVAGSSVLTANNLNYTSDGLFTFNGTSSYILSSSPNLPTVAGSGNKTFIVWCQPDSTGPANTYTGLLALGTHSSTTPSSTVLLSLNTNNSSTYYVSSAYWGNDYVPNNIVVTPNAWNMIGIVARGAATTNNATLFCGNATGLSFTTGSSSSYTKGLNTSNTDLTIGCTDVPGRFFKGKISNVLIYDRELSTAEITQIYQSMRGRYGI